MIAHKVIVFINQSPAVFIHTVKTLGKSMTVNIGQLLIRKKLLSHHILIAEIINTGPDYPVSLAVRNLHKAESFVKFHFCAVGMGKIIFLLSDGYLLRYPGILQIFQYLLLLCRRKGLKRIVCGKTAVTGVQPDINIVRVHPFLVLNLEFVFQSIQHKKFMVSHKHLGILHLHQMLKNLYAVRSSVNNVSQYIQFIFIAKTNQIEHFQEGLILAMYVTHYIGTHLRSLYSISMISFTST